MNNRLLFLFAIIALFSTIFAVFAKGINIEDITKKQEIIITLKNEANIEIPKNKILEIPHVKIISTKYRDKEWSKMVNKYDLPNMENPFKNEFIIKTNKNADITEIYNKIKDMDFVETIEYVFEKENSKEQKIGC